MKLIADTHVHIYPGYELSSVFNSAWKNLSSFGAKKAEKALFLTERSNCHFFKTLCSDSSALPAGYSFSACSDSSLGIITNSNGERLWILPGRQVNTKERIEVLALGSDTEVKDDQPLIDTLKAVIDIDAYPVIPWGLGKWLGKRGDIIKQLVGDCPFSFAIGDTSLRPAFWFYTPLFTRGKTKGLSLLAGTDPLPQAGEEKVIGSYATLFENEFDPANPLASIKSLIRTSPVSLCGQRNNVLSFVKRGILKH